MAKSTHGDEEVTMELSRGHGDQKPSEIAKQVTSLAGTQVVHVSSGWNYAATITGNGDLCKWWGKYPR